MKNVSIISRGIFANTVPHPHFQLHLGMMQHGSAGTVTNSVMLQTFENFTGFSHILPCSTASITWARNISLH